MSDRKETPDILGNLLGEPASSQRLPDILPDRARKQAPAKRMRKKPDATRKTQSRAKPTAAPMDSRQVVWEYREVKFYDYGGYVVRYIDDRELPDWKNSPHLNEFIGQMGRKGWEMVSLLSPKRHYLLAIFKRLVTV